MASKSYVFILLIRQIRSVFETFTEQYIFYINISLQFSHYSLESKKERQHWSEKGKMGIDLSNRSDMG